MKLQLLFARNTLLPRRSVLAIFASAWSLCSTAQSRDLLPAATQGGELSAPQALAAQEAGQLILIDIRQPEEWKETGVAKGAVRISMRHPKGGDGFMADILRATAGNKNAPIALICRTGNRTTHVQQYLQSQGFGKVWQVSEGMAGSKAGPGWLRRGLPLD